MPFFITIFVALLLSSSIVESQSKCIEGDCYNGFGTESYINLQYSGYFRFGKAHGKGTLHYTDTDEYPKANDKIIRTYKGEFEDNLPYGEGTLWVNGGSGSKGYFWMERRGWDVLSREEWDEEHEKKKTRGIKKKACLVNVSKSAGSAFPIA